MLSRRPIVPIAVLFLTLAATAQAGSRFAPAGDCDFGPAKWGMSVRQVRNAVSGTPVAADECVVSWQKDVGGQPCTVSYLFHRDRLCMGIYQFSDTNPELQTYFDDARTYREELVTVYGDPQIEKWRWADEVFEKDEALWGEALGFGLVQYELGWVSGRSLVAMRLSGGNTKADVVVLVADLTCFAESRRAFAAYFEQKIGLPSPYFR